MSEDRRRDPRRDTCRIGRMQVADGAPWLECLVWDLSAGGALIECEHATPPDRFLLTIDDASKPRRCRVLRRDGTRYAVVFLADTEH